MPKRKGQMPVRDEGMVMRRCWTDDPCSGARPLLRTRRKPAVSSSLVHRFAPAILAVCSQLAFLRCAASSSRDAAPPTSFPAAGDAESTGQDLEDARFGRLQSQFSAVGETISTNYSILRRTDSSDGNDIQVQSTYTGFAAVNVTISCHYVDKVTLTLHVVGNVTARIARRGLSTWLRADERGVGISLTRETTRSRGNEGADDTLLGRSRRLLGVAQESSRRDEEHRAADVSSSTVTKLEVTVEGAVLTATAATKMRVFATTRKGAAELSEVLSDTEITEPYTAEKPAAAKSSRAKTVHPGNEEKIHGTRGSSSSEAEASGNSEEEQQATPPSSTTGQKPNAVPGGSGTEEQKESGRRRRLEQSAEGKQNATTSPRKKTPSSHSKISNWISNTVGAIFQKERTVEPKRDIKVLLRPRNGPTSAAPPRAGPRADHSYAPQLHVSKGLTPCTRYLAGSATVGGRAIAGVNMAGEFLIIPLNVCNDIAEVVPLRLSQTDVRRTGNHTVEIQITAQATLSRPFEAACPGAGSMAPASAAVDALAVSPAVVSGQTAASTAPAAKDGQLAGRSRGAAVATSHAGFFGHTVTVVGPYVVKFGGVAASQLHASSDGISAPLSNRLYAMLAPTSSASAGSPLWTDLDDAHGIYLQKPKPRFGHVATGTSDGYFVMFGGRDADGRYLDDMWLIRLPIEPNARARELSSKRQKGPDDQDSFYRWRKCDRVPSRFQQRHFIGGARLRDHWVLFGGQKANGALSNDLWQVDVRGLIRQAEHAARESQEPMPRSVSRRERDQLDLEERGTSLTTRRREGDTTEHPIWTRLGGSARKSADVPQARVGHTLSLCLVHEDKGGLLLFGGLVARGSFATADEQMWFFDVRKQRWERVSGWEKGGGSGRTAFHVAHVDSGCRSLAVVGGLRESSDSASGIGIAKEVRLLSLRGGEKGTKQKQEEQTEEEPSGSQKPASKGDEEDASHAASSDKSKSSSAADHASDSRASENNDDASPAAADTSSSTSSKKQTSTEEASHSSSQRGSSKRSEDSRRALSSGGEKPVGRWTTLAEGGSRGEEARFSDPSRKRDNGANGAAWLSFGFGGSGSSSGVDKEKSEKEKDASEREMRFPLENTLANLGRVAGAAGCFWPAVGQFVIDGGARASGEFGDWLSRAAASSAVSAISGAAVLPPVLGTGTGKTAAASPLTLLLRLDDEGGPSPGSAAARPSSTSGRRETLACDVGSVPVLVGGKRAQTAVSTTSAAATDPTQKKLRRLADQIPLPPWSGAEKMRSENSDGEQDVAVCVACPPGTVAVAGACVPCPVGFHNPLSGMIDARACRPCAFNTFGATSGLAVCEPCRHDRDAAAEDGKSAKPSKANQDAPAALRMLDTTPDETSVSTLFAQAIATAAATAGRPSAVVSRPFRHSSMLTDRAREHINNPGPDSAASTCPLMAFHPQQRAPVAHVREKNEPHGDAALKTHAWWQQVTLTVGVVVTAFLTTALLLIHVKIPRKTARILRRVDMRPITGSIVPSEAGGIIFLMYAIVASCVLFFTVFRHNYANQALSSMALPEEEDLGRGVEEIRADFQTTALLDGYVGGCVAGDSRRDGSRNPDSNYDATGGLSALSRSVGSPSSSVLWSGEEVTTTFENDENQPYQCHEAIRLTVTGFTQGYSIRCKKTGPQQCRVYLSCPNCSIDLDDEHRFARVLLDVFDPSNIFTAAREIRWSLAINWLRRGEEEAASADEAAASGEDPVSESARSRRRRALSAKPSEGVESDPPTKWDARRPSGKKEAYSRVDVSVTPGRSPYESATRVLRGRGASVVRIALVPTDYRDLIQNLQLFGFVAQFVEQSAKGETVGVDELFTSGEAGELHSEIQIEASHTAYKLILSPKRTFFDVCSMLLGFLSGMSLIARVVTAVWTQNSKLCGFHIICGARNPLLYYLAMVFCFWLEKDLDYDDDEVLTLAPDSPHSLPQSPLSARRSESREGHHGSSGGIVAIAIPHHVGGAGKSALKKGGASPANAGGGYQKVPSKDSHSPGPVVVTPRSEFGPYTPTGGPVFAGGPNAKALPKSARSKNSLLSDGDFFW